MVTCSVVACSITNFEGFFVDVLFMFNPNHFILSLQLLRIIYVLSLCKYTWAELCGGNGESLKYLRGDALTDNLDCIGPNGKPYPE